MNAIFTRASAQTYAIHHALYCGANPSLCFQWRDFLDAGHTTNGHFLYEGDVLIGGIDLSPEGLSLPFFAPPFEDRPSFWRAVLSQYRVLFGREEVTLRGIGELDAAALCAIGARTLYAQRRMIRPTASLGERSVPGISLRSLTQADRDAIIRVAVRAHEEGAIARILGAPTLEGTRHEIDRRYLSFGQTDTLSMGTVAIDEATGELVGLCMTGVYPEPPGDFSCATIHQLSVHPNFQGRGIASAMMARSISLAHEKTVAIGLGVYVGNPAERLYRKMGFAAGPAFARMIHSAV